MRTHRKHTNSVEDGEVLGMVQPKKGKTGTLRAGISLRVKSNAKTGGVGRSHIEEGLEHWSANGRF